MDKHVGTVTNLSFRLTPYKDTFKDQLARVGWLRAAYLVAFAEFGYLYVFQRRLESVRRQLAEPAANVIDLFSVVLPEATAQTRHFVIIEEPLDLRGLALQMGRSLVFLPWLSDGLYDRLSARSKNDRRFGETLKGGLVPWPAEPLHLMDFDRVKGIEVTRSAGTGDTR
jgi:hypothetical protein